MLRFLLVELPLPLAPVLIVKTRHVMTRPVVALKTGMKARGEMSTNVVGVTARAGLIVHPVATAVIEEIPSEVKAEIAKVKSIANTETDALELLPRVDERNAIRDGHPVNKAVVDAITWDLRPEEGS